MKPPVAQLNLIVAWLWILLGFVSGMALGMFFHRENWLGGYASLKRRMYRLAHISFFGLGAVNLFFWLTVRNIPISGPFLDIASWAFVIGAVTMPVCCVIMAHFPKLHLIFSVPVISLLVGGGLMVVSVTRSGHFDASSEFEALSLTPALSRWERGRPSAVSLFPDDSLAWSTLRNTMSRRTILPLPAGEARGEGERFEYQSPPFSRTSNQWHPNNLFQS